MARENSATGNNGALEALFIAEILKPQAIERTIELGEREMGYLEKALPILEHDHTLLSARIGEIQAQRSSSIGVIADRIANGYSEHSIESDSAIEDHKDGKLSRERAVLESGYVTNDMLFLARQYRIAIECIRRAAKNKGKTSFADAERMARAISTVAQPIAVSIAAEKGRESAGALAAASRSIDKLLEDDLYSVSRRLSMKYFGQDALDEMDGYLKTNARTGKQKDISLLGDLPTRDTGTDIRVLSSEGLMKLAMRFSSASISEGKLSVKQGRSTAFIDISLSEGDLSLLRNAAEKFEPRTESAAGSMEKESEELLASLFEAMGNNMPEKIGDKDRRRILAGMMLKARICAQRGDYAASLRNLRDPQGLLEPIRKDYQEMHDARNALKNAYIMHGISISYEQDGSDAGSSGFPFDAENPFGDIHFGKLLTLYSEAALAISRLDALPLELIDIGTKQGARVHARASELRRRYEGTRNNIRMRLDPIMAMGRDEAKSKLLGSIQGKGLRGDASGWFSSDELRQVFTDAAIDALGSIAYSSDETIRKMVEIFDKEESAPIPGIRKNMDGSPSKAMRATRAKDGVLLVEPPMARDLTLKAKAMLVCNAGVTHAIDKAVPEGQEAFYDDPGRTLFKETLANWRKSLSASARSSRDTSAIRAYAEIAKILDACMMADPDGRCAKIMKQAEERGKEIAIERFCDSFEAMRNAFAYAEDATMEGPDGETLSIADAYTASGRALGERAIRLLSMDIMRRAGLDDKAQGALEDGSANAASRFVLSAISTAVADATLSKISEDMGYAEAKNISDSIWSSPAATKNGAEYDSLLKGAVPVLLDDAIATSLRKAIGKGDILYNAAFLMDIPQAREKALSRLEDSIKAERSETRRRIEVLSAPMDSRANRALAEELEDTVLSWEAIPDAASRSIALMDAIIANNPDSEERVGELRSLVGKGTREGRDQALDIIGGLMHMSPISRANPSLPADYLERKDDEWVDGMRARALAIEEEARLRELLSPREEACIMAALSGAFSDEHSIARGFCGDERYKKVVEKVGQEDFERKLRIAANDLERAREADLDLALEGIAKGIASKGAVMREPAMLPKAPLLSSLSLSKGEIASTPKVVAARLENAGFTPRSSNSLRDPAMAKALVSGTRPGNELLDSRALQGFESMVPADILDSWKERFRYKVGAELNALYGHKGLDKDGEVYAIYDFKEIGKILKKDPEKGKRMFESAMDRLSSSKRPKAARTELAI